MNDPKKDKINAPLSIREKIVVKLVIFLITVLRPWEYNHQFTEFFQAIKEDLDIKQSK